MFDALKAHLILVLSILFVTFLSAKAFSGTGIPKEEWIKKFKPLASPVMCKTIFKRDDTSQMLKAKDITYDKCVNLISTSLDRCVDKFLPQLPAEITIDDAKKWGGEIGLCTGQDFYQHNISEQAEKS